MVIENCFIPRNQSQMLGQIWKRCLICRRKECQRTGASTLDPRLLARGQSSKGGGPTSGEDKGKMGILSTEKTIPNAA